MKRPRRGTGTGSGLLGDLIEVFQPSRRHVVEEQERHRHDVQLPEAGAPPLVDLESGTAYLAPEPGRSARPHEPRPGQAGPADAPRQGDGPSRVRPS